MMSGAKGGSQFDATMGLLEIMQDPKKYKKQMEEFATREKSALAAEKKLNAQTSEMLKIKSDLDKEEKRLQKDLKDKIKSYEKALEDNEKLKFTLLQDIALERANIDQRLKEAKALEAKANETLRVAGNKEAGVRAKMADLNMQKEALEAEKREIERIKKLIEQI